MHFDMDKYNTTREAFRRRAGIKKPAVAGFFIASERLARQPAAVYRNGIAVNIVRRAGRQEHDRPHQVAR